MGSSGAKSLRQRFEIGDAPRTRACMCVCGGSGGGGVVLRMAKSPRRADGRRRKGANGRRAVEDDRGVGAGTCEPPA